MVCWWYLDLSKEQIRTAQVRTSKARTGQVRTGQVGTGLVRTGQLRTGQVGTSQVGTSQFGDRSSQVGTVKPIKSSWDKFSQTGQARIFLRPKTVMDLK